MNTIIDNYLNPTNGAKTNESSASESKTDKLFNQVNELMKDLILIPDYKRPIDFENRVLAILQPRRGNNLKVKRWVNDFYFNYMDDEPNFQHFSNRDCDIQ